MEEKLIYISNDPEGQDNVLEEIMISISEKLNAKIIIKDFATDNSEIVAAPTIIMCDSVNVQDEIILSNIDKIYRANQHIILYKPTNIEINAVYKKLEGRKYYLTDDEVIRYNLFGLKTAENGVRYVLENYEEEENFLADNIADFLEGKNELPSQPLAFLNKAADSALTAQHSDKNLAEMARRHIITQSFELAGKRCSLNYYMVSCHKYEGKEVDGGEDWFFIQQYGILNGAPNYDKHWAGTRVKVNGDSWYVGQGEVCLNYVDYYKMSNYIDKPNSTQLIYVDPTAINNVTSYTVNESIQIGGTIGFEASGSGSGAEGKGSGSFTTGGNFSSSYKFEVRDCTCKNISMSINLSSAEWEYQFKRAEQNREAGKWQRLHDPALLSYSVFSPFNSWVWKFNTKDRNNNTSFISKIEIGIMNTISRYSGSQPPKHIPGTNKDNQKSFNITFNMPPLLCVSTETLMFGKEKSTKQISIVVQGNWYIKKDKLPSWLRASQYYGDGDVKGEDKEKIISISVDKNMTGKERHETLNICRKSGGEKGTSDEVIKVMVIQSAGSID